MAHDTPQNTLPDHTMGSEGDAAKPQGASWSAVQHLLWETNHMKKRHLP